MNRRRRSATTHDGVVLARLIKDLTGSRPELVFRPLPHDDPRQRRPDTSEARVSAASRKTVTK